VNTSNFVTSGEHELTRQRTTADHNIHFISRPIVGLISNEIMTSG